LASNNTVGILTRELQEECGGFFGGGGMTSCRVSVRHHRFCGLQSCTRQQKTSQKREYCHEQKTIQKQKTVVKRKLCYKS